MSRDNAITTIEANSKLLPYALVVEMVGSVGHDVSTRFSIVTAFGNVPLAYMTSLDGMGAKNFGTHGLIWTDAIGNFLVVAVIVLALLFRRKRGALIRSA